MKTEQTKPATVRSEATRARMKERALMRGKERSDEIEARVRKVMGDIEAEMASNEGIYPHNGGAISGAEVARRAGIHETTLFSPKQRVFGSEVKTWLDELKATKVVGRMPVRRDLSERLDDWKTKYEGLCQSHRDTELQLQQTEAELAEALKEVKRLQGENGEIRALLSKSGAPKVVPIRKKKD